jgi:hypothetical protein
MPHHPPSCQFFPCRSLYIPNIILMRKKRLAGGEDVKKVLGGMWMAN